MEFSGFNIFSRVKDSDKYFIINSLYGIADIIESDTYTGLLNGNLSRQELISRGYIVDPDYEKAEFRNAYLRFVDERESDEIQLFFVTGYNCNFGCYYCYQSEYIESGGSLNEAVIDSFYQYIDLAFAGRRKYITLFGGEPLMPGKRHRSLVERIIEKAAERDIDIAVVTNGYHIADYINLLKKARIREVQVTLDGIRDVHDNRRYLKNGRGSFDRIVKGIDLLLNNCIPVNLRVVVDRDNILGLPDLASFAIDRGWTKSPFMSTQLGRNYELHECQVNRERLFSRLEMYNDIYQLIIKHPHIREFHKPAFSVARHLSEHGELPPPMFDSCPGTKTEWAFDFTGNIYACTATVGKKGEELGQFFPERFMYDERIEQWSERDILSIKECRDCNLGVLCGGGCAAVAKNRTGMHNSPDCRPVRELLELGISAYFRQEEIDNEQ